MGVRELGSNPASTADLPRSLDKSPVLSVFPIKQRRALVFFPLQIVPCKAGLRSDHNSGPGSRQTPNQTKGPCSPRLFHGNSSSNSLVAAEQNNMPTRRRKGDGRIGQTASQYSSQCPGCTQMPDARDSL